MLQMNIVCSQQ